MYISFIIIVHVIILYAGVDLAVPEAIELTEGEMSQLCVSVSEGQPDHERNIDLDFSVTFGNMYTGG